MTDFIVADHGSIILITPVSKAAQEWIDENVVSEPWQWLAARSPWTSAVPGI